MMNSNIVFVINDFFGHGGHVKSFLSCFLSLDISNSKIICASDGYIVNNHINLGIDSDILITV